MTPFPFRFLYRCVVCSLKLQSIQLWTGIRHDSQAVQE
uniref:Uncharacterized protein n=1 Tax=Anguilla anguilla TaxID=7936 RepID=A0A0E9UVU9_ANGAN